MSGTLALQPRRYENRADEPRDSPEINATAGPVVLSPLELTVWRDILSKCHKGVVRESDSIALIVFAKLATSVIYSQGCPDIKSTNALLQYFARFGMTPVDRSRVQAPKKEEGPNPYAEFGKPRRVA